MTCYLVDSPTILKRNHSFNTLFLWAWLTHQCRSEHWVQLSSKHCSAFYNRASKTSPFFQTLQCKMCLGTSNSPLHARLCWLSTRASTLLLKAGKACCPSWEVDGDFGKKLMVCKGCCVGGTWGQELGQSGRISEGHLGLGSEALWEVGKVSICAVRDVTWSDFMVVITEWFLD